MNAPIRLFSSPLLEGLTRARPRTVVLLWCAVIGALAGWVAGDFRFALWPALAAAAAGWLAWTPFEYAVHRYLFHWNPAGSAARRLVFVMHGCHHAQPDDPLRVMMPPAASVPVALALFGLASLALEGPWLHAGFAGFLAGYLRYDVTHWASHQVSRRIRLARALRTHHLRHHYVSDTGNFGVSTRLWDKVFGTLLPPSRPARKP